MRKGLKACAIINFIMVAFGMMIVGNNFFLFSLSNLSLVIFFIATGVLYLRYSTLPIKELHKKRKVILGLGIVSLFINLLSAIILFIVHDKIQKEYELVPLYDDGIENVEPKKVIPPEIRKLDIMLKLGVSMVAISGLIFATTSWDIIPDSFKILFLILFGALFIGLSKFCEIKLKLMKTVKIYWILGVLFFIFSYITIGYFELFGEWFSFDGGGKYLFTTILCLITSLLSFISYTKFDDQEWIFISYAGFFTAIYTFMSFFDICPNIRLLLIISLLSIINSLKESDIKEFIYLKKFSKIASLIVSSLIIINFISLDNVKNISIIIIISIITILNLIYITLKRNDEVFGMITPFLVSSLIFTTIIKLDFLNITTTLLLTASFTIIYLILLLSNLSSRNKTFNTIFSITTNLSLMGTILYSNSINEYIFLLTTLIFLIANIIIILFKDDDNNISIKIENYLQPIKILFFASAYIQILNIDYTIIDSSLEYCFYSLLMLSLYFTSFKENIKYEYFLLFCFLLFHSLILNLSFLNNNKIAISILQLFLFIIPFLIAKNNQEKRYNVLKYPLYVLFLAAIYNIFVYVNFLDLSNILAATIVMGIYFIIMIICFQEKKLFTITFLFTMFPYDILINHIPYTYEVKTIITTTLHFYLLLLTCTNLIKNEKNKHLIATIISSIIMLSIIFEQNLIIGLYIGIISIILIYIGFIEDKYKNIFYLGIIVTILNIIIQLWEFWSKIPFWLYLLIAGLGTIGTVTYLEIKKTNNTTDDKSIPIPVSSDDDKTKI